MTGSALPQRPRCSCGQENCEHLTDDQSRDFYSGAYETCKLLLTSPRMHRPQREVIEDVATAIREEMVALGVKFTPAGSQR